MRRIIPVGFFFFASYAHTSLACTCFGPQHEWAIQASAAIFAAEVVSEVEFPQPVIDRKFQVRVLALWKGDIPESTIVDAGSGCGYPLEVGHSYLIYMHRDDVQRRAVELCSGTGPLNSLYYDRYLLGDPTKLYEPTFETVTLETILGLLASDRPDAPEMAWHFTHFQYEVNLLLPRLLRIANGMMPGNRLAALRAIRSLGESAVDAYPLLAGIRWQERDPAIRAERLLAMTSVSRDFARMEPAITKALADDSSVVRRAAIASLGILSDSDDAMRLSRRGLEDEDPQVRRTALQALRWYSDAEVARRVKQLAIADEDALVRSDARDYLKLRDFGSRSGRGGQTVRGRGFKYKRPIR